MNLQISQFFDALEESIQKNTFIKLSLGNYKGKDDQLKNIYIKRILIKNEVKLSFTYRFKTRDIVKNFEISEGLGLIQDAFLGGFKVASLFNTDAEYLLEMHFNQKITLKKKLLTTPKEAVSLDHNRTKNRLIQADGKNYLQALQITDEAGVVFKNAQDKYKQINHYIEILSSLIKEIPTKNDLKVVDMGSGKGYLTFALYDYLTNVLKLNASLIGVEFRPDMVELSNKIAENADFEQLKFIEGTIENFDSSGTNMLIALHACDTATDDAIFKGITAAADLIVVAPCCHKQIRREIEKNKAKNDLDFLLKYGIFLERQAEMVTDGIRALILEYFGYKTKVFEFISDAHTPKNVLIVGIKSDKVKPKNKAVLQQIQAAKAYFGIEKHHLEKLLF